MADTKHSAYSSLTSVLTTQADALANNGNTAASSAIDNTGNKHILADVEIFVNTQGSARTAGGQVILYLLTSADGGTTYDDINTSTSEAWCALTLDASTGSRRRTIRNLDIPALFFKIAQRNETGQAFGATGNTVKILTHYVTTA